MASQPSSVQNEERNRLRLQAWEQRNQKTSQSDEFNLENFPVFREPYKVHKGDELSNRIRRMLGSYEDVNSPGQLSVEGLPIPTHATFPQSYQRPPTCDKSTKPPLHCQVPRSSTESQTITYSSQPTKMSSSSSSPEDVRRFSTTCTPSLNHSQSSELSHSPHQLRNGEIPSHLMEMSSSPHTEPPPLPSRSNDCITTDTDAKESFDLQQLQLSKDLLSESDGTVEVSTQNIRQSPKDIVVSQPNKTGTLPSHAYPPLLSSKQPRIIMTQKPTAYVRPMDGQDEVVGGSPELKRSPEPYVPVTEMINKSDLSKANMKPQSSVTRADEAQCVEDILREMTRSWPPLLTALHTPNTQAPSKFHFPLKEAERVASRPGQNNCGSSSSVSSDFKQQPSFNSSNAARCSGRGTASSSDYDSSSGSESENDGTTQEPLKALPKSQQAAGPALGRGDWQLGNWIRSGHRSSNTESHDDTHVPESPTHKRRLHPQSSKHSSGEVIDLPTTSKPWRSSRQKDLITDASFPQRRSEKVQDKPQLHSRRELASADVKEGDSSRTPSQTTAAGFPDRIVKATAPVAALTKHSCFTDKPKVKTKHGRGEKTEDKSATKTDLRRSKDTSLNGQKAAVKTESSVSLILPAPSRPARSGPPSLAPAHSKAKAEALCQQSNRKPHKSTLKQPGRLAGAASGPSRPPASLWVKIDLNLLCRVTQTPADTRGRIPNTVKTLTTAATMRERPGGGSNVSAKRKRTKTSKEHQMPNLDGEDSTPLRKKRKLENNNTCFVASGKAEISNKPSGSVVKKKVKKTARQAVASTGNARDPRPEKSSSVRSSGEAERSRDVFKQKNAERPGEKKKPPKRSAKAPTRPSSHASTTRPLLRPEERPRPVKHYIKEAKRLKHRADAESDKLSKAFSYLEAAMFFVESGIAMETDPQISMSSFTMFAETVELLKFVLKMKNSAESSSPSENDFLSLCLKCQSLLQMEMFRHKHKTALKYSKILSEFFDTSAQTTLNPPEDPSAPGTPSPVAMATGPAGTAVVVPRGIERVALGYVDITTLVLNAQDVWERAEELAQSGSGLLSELDAVVGRLSLSSLMSSMVRYTRQGVHWLRLDSLHV